jgi:hypothetical protein
MAAWQPNPDSLQTLAACLKDSLSGFNKTAQKQAELVSVAGRKDDDRMPVILTLLPDVEPGQVLT